MCYSVYDERPDKNFPFMDDNTHGHKIWENDEQNDRGHGKLDSRHGKLDSGHGKLDSG